MALLPCVARTPPRLPRMGLEGRYTAGRALESSMFVKPLILAALSFAAMWLAASSFAAPPSSAAPPPKPCYSPGMPAPPITRQTVVMIDLTTARDSAVIADFSRAVALAAVNDAAHLVGVTAVTRTSP